LWFNNKVKNMNELDMKKLTDRLDYIIQLLEEREQREGTEFKPMSEKTPSPPPMPDIEQALRGAGVNVSQLEINPDLVKPKTYLGDDWAPVNAVMRRYGWSWISAGRDSRWERGEAQPSKTEEPATKKQLDYLHYLGADDIKEGLTKREASKLIEHYKSRQQ